METFFFNDDTDRVDGIDKVTGKATYFAEYQLPGTTYGVLVTSTITKGKILTMDTKAAENAPGVISVVSHLNRPTVPGYEQAGGSPMKIFYTDKIWFNGQPIAIVVADTFERATFAASLVNVTYEKESFSTDFEKNLSYAKLPAREYLRGEANAYKKAEIQVESEYRLPIETHNPMELHGILANWESDDHLTVYAKTQGVKSTQNTLASVFKLAPQNVQVHSKFVGGAFGMGLKTWPLEIAAVIAAKKVGKPVKLVITRMQMFTMTGNRPAAWQKMGLGATKEGILTGITHESIGETASYEDFQENITGMSKFMYKCDNVNTSQKLLPLDVSVPIWMRGPGEATGSFALESAMDEMAHKIGMDPIAFRLKNYTETDPEKGKPYSSKFVKEAYELGAAKIGWKNRKNTPDSSMNSNWQTGYGMSTGVFSASRGRATARGVLNADGTLILQSAASDIGPGTGTGMIRIASEVMKIPQNKITFELGDSLLPQAPSQGGSATLSTVGSAVNDVCEELKKLLTDLATKNNIDPKLPFEEILKKSGQATIEATKQSQASPEMRNYSLYSFSLHFVIVKVNRHTGVVKIDKIVSVGDAGTIVSPKTARSQMIGGAVGGIGMALTEESIIDHRYGRYINNNFADYHVPVNADTPEIDVIFVNKPDPIINAMGAKGMGEIALIGFSAAVANAVFNATGKRIRSLPITPDKVLLA